MEIDRLIKKWFGDAPTQQLDGATAFLESHGYVLRKGYVWDLPTQYHVPSCHETMCIRYLIEEWDYGGVAMEYEPRACHCVCGKVIDRIQYGYPRDGRPCYE